MVPMGYTECSLSFLSSILFFILLLIRQTNSGMSNGEPLSVIDGGEGGNITDRHQTFIVHVRKPDGAEFLTDESLDDWYRSFLPNTTLDSGMPRLVYSYYQTVSGFAARLTPHEVRAMETTDGFLRAEPDKELQLGTTYTYTFLGLSEHVGVWPTNYFGSGVVIGVIDTGILPSHPSFSDTNMPPPPDPKWLKRCGFRPPLHCNNKIIAARSYVNGAFPSPADNDGHGTHVAGIAAGNFVDGASVLGQAAGRAAGTAPKAHLAIYKVGLRRTDLTKGIDTAIADGVDILSMSIVEYTADLNDSSVTLATFHAVKKGIFFSACAGNKGPNPSVIGDDAPWLMTVGASNTDRRITATVRFQNGSQVVGESVFKASQINSTISALLAFPGRAGHSSRDCERKTLINPNVTGKIVMCDPTGDINLPQMGRNVKKAGGTAMIVLSEFGNTTSALEYVLPTVHLPASESIKMRDYFVATPNAAATIIFEGTQFGTMSAPAVTVFSGRGPSLVNGEINKPDIVAPGNNILSASNKPGRRPRYTFMSGTSMATPHISGIAALIKNAHPDWSPAAIKSAMMTTAYTKDLSNTNILDQETNLPATMDAMGSGHVDPSAAVDPGLVYDIRPPQYLKYLCGMGFTDSVVSRFNSHKQVQCSSIGSIRPEELNYPSVFIYLNATTTSVTVKRKATNVGVANSTYSLQPVEPKFVCMTVTPKVLQFSNLKETKSYQVQFSIQGTPPPGGAISEGELSWVFNKYSVRIPVAVLIDY